MPGWTASPLSPLPLPWPADWVLSWLTTLPSWMELLLIAFRKPGILGLLGWLQDWAVLWSTRSPTCERNSRSKSHSRRSNISMRRSTPYWRREKEHERYHENVMAEVVLQEPGGGRERLNSMVGGSGSSRSELLVEQHPPPRESRMERQLSTEQLIQARRDELPQEVWRERAERAERKLERQTSSELEGHEVRRRDRHRPERQGQQWAGGQGAVGQTLWRRVSDCICNH